MGLKGGVAVEYVLVCEYLNQVKSLSEQEIVRIIKVIYLYIYLSIHSSIHPWLPELKGLLRDPRIDLELERSLFEVST